MATKPSQSAARAIEAFNNDSNRPFDMVAGERVYYHARLPILATDCDYEIVSISGVQGRRVPQIATTRALPGADA